LAGDSVAAGEDATCAQPPARPSHPLLEWLVRLTTGLARITRRLEARYGLPGAALLLAMIVLLVAAVYARPSSTPVNHGVLYARLSEAPFAFVQPNWVQYRLLTPLIGYLSHLRGWAFVLLPPLIMVAWLASVYGRYRRGGFDGAAALAVMAMMAFSTPTLFPLHSSGSVDQTSSLS
jgi:hypothetical protein